MRVAQTVTDQDTPARREAESRVQRPVISSAYKSMPISTALSRVPFRSS